MSLYSTKILFSLAVNGLLLSSYASANTLSELSKAASEATTDISLRYRYEMVEQDGVPEDAHASTLKARLSWKSGEVKGWFGKVEVDTVSLLGSDNYNDTLNGRSDHPVVADPKGTDLNQAYLGYKAGGLLLTAGRQRIVHGNQRFVGGVAWRQNEQTFDGYRAQWNASESIKLDYSYVYNVNRIFGPDGARADLKGQIHLFDLGYKLSKGHNVSFHYYSLDFDTAAALSNNTLGVTYDGKLGPVKLHAAYAKQTDTGDNPVDYSADYWNLEVGTKLSMLNLSIGYELLGSDNGKGFVTPLATLHKFQGFADKFLATPGAGVEDLYIKGSGKIGKLGLSVTWHDLSADEGNADYGDEWDLVAKYPLVKNAGLLVKYARFSSDEFASDTDKFWAMLNYKL